MADSTLEAIRKKVRRLTRSPSEQQISSADIDEYINTFIQYDFPQELRLFTLRKTLTFYTEPNIDTYETNATAGDPLNNFKNVYTGVFNPIYIAGRESSICQSEAAFYRLYPLTNSIKREAAGDGVTVAFAGTLTSIPVLRNNVIFNAIDATGDGLELHDDPDNPGALIGDGTGTINYITGVYTLTFNSAPASGENINSLTIPYVASRPDTVLFFDNKFIVRPVPDQVYPVQVEVDMRPTELLLTTDTPELEQWWQYIAYGASKKMFEDRSDMASIQEIMPEFKNQETLVLRRTIVLQTKERVATIYTENTAGQYGPGLYDSGNF